MIELTQGGTACLQQAVSGTGTFTGVSMGYAKLTVTQSGHVIVFRARHMGTAGNSLQVVFTDPGADLPACKAVFVQATGVLTVNLKKVSGSITATMAEIASAVNALKCEIVAGVTTNGTAAALTATSLAGGIEPTQVSGSFFKMAPPANQAGGLFYFENDVPVCVTGVYARFNSATNPFTATVSIVNVDPALNIITGEDIVVMQQVLTAAPFHIALTDARIVLMPWQAIKIAGASDGVARCTARMEAPTSFM